jgi:signal transduction histidine kinase
MTVEGAPLPLDQRPVYRALRGEQGAGVELKVRRNDSGETWVGNYSFAPIRDEHGLIVGGVIGARDVTTEKDLLAELERSRLELRRLLACQHGAAEGERKRIARELHDDLQQTLAALRLNVAAVEQQVQAHAEAREAATCALALAESAIMSTRLIIAGLRPQILDDLGLQEALASTLSAFGERNAVGWDFEVLGEADVELPADVATGLFRITQEALQNIEKHARADFVQITLDLSDPQQVVLQIHDDGLGIQSVNVLKRMSFGLLGMEERARAMGGTLRVTPGAVSGTMVEAVVRLASGPGS